MCSSVRSGCPLAAHMRAYARPVTSTRRGCTAARAFITSMGSSTWWESTVPTVLRVGKGGGGGYIFLQNWRGIPVRCAQLPTHKPVNPANAPCTASYARLVHKLESEAQGGEERMM